MKKEPKIKIEKAKFALQQAEYILLGGGAGLSAAAGLTYNGDRFVKNFRAFIEKYGIQDMYSAGFYPFSTSEERWAYWSKHILLNRYDTPALKLYIDLLQLVKGKEYFVLTTNVDHQFFKAGFSDKKIFAVQGDYGYFQCAKACHDTLYNNENAVKEMVAQTVCCKIPSQLVPRCPVCGGQMEANIRKDLHFVQDIRWYAANERYRAFRQESRGKKLVLLELGVGFNTPGIIRFPFEEIINDNENAILIRVNKFHAQSVNEHQERIITFQEDISGIIKML